MNITIDMGRVLLGKRDQGRVLGRFMTWAREKGYDNLPTPSVFELRWSDDFTQLYVSKLSGLIEHGFDTMYPEHYPIIDNEKWAVYTDKNPAANVLLSAIRDVTRSHLTDVHEVSDG